MTEREADEQMRAHFDERAAEYDSFWLAEPERPGWSAEVEQLIGVVQALPAARVLDVACGTGFLTQHLRGEVVALDQSARMVEIAAARLPHARVVQGDAEPLPFDDGEFDRVFTSHFFHHLPSDRRAAFVADARRVGRELVVVEDLHDAPADESHRHSFTAAELVAELGDGHVLHEGRWFVVVASKPALLAGGNPQIAKADGDAPVQAYIAALPGWKRDVGLRLDALITATVPDVRKAVKWNSPFYGSEGQGWFLSFHSFTKYVKVAFFRGSSLRPLPPGESKSEDTRYLDIYEADELDQELLASWIAQAAELPGWIP